MSFSISSIKPKMQADGQHAIPGFLLTNFTACRSLEKAATTQRKQGADLLPPDQSASKSNTDALHQVAYDVQYSASEVDAVFPLTAMAVIMPACTNSKKKSNIIQSCHE